MRSRAAAADTIRPESQSAADLGQLHAGPSAASWTRASQAGSPARPRLVG